MSGSTDRGKDRRTAAAVLGAKRGFSRAAVLGPAEVGVKAAQLVALTPTFKSEADAERQKKIENAVRPIIRRARAKNGEIFMSGYLTELDRILHRD